MPASPATKDIFLNALAMGAHERELYLSSACTDPESRREVDGLLAAFNRAGQFLEPAPRPGATDMYRQTPGGPERRVGKYTILERLGEGGFGVVYRAEQTEPIRRYAALKIVKLGMDTQEVLKRFQAERQAVAMMDHPSIATLYDAGVTDGGRPYFVMELVMGEAITAYCKQRALPVTERVRLFVKVCRAVQHAHNKGVVHRDIKPSNVLVVQREGEAVPKVIDFGIAKALHTPLSDATMTSRGQFVGTPQYMSPEQALSDTSAIDTRSDVYSLGALLYELLTGTAPIESAALRGKDIAQVLSIVREGHVERASERLKKSDARAAGQLAGDLDWIVHRAIEKSPGQRYQTADALADDLERFLEDRPIVAGPPSRVGEVRRFARRHAAWVLAGTVTGMAVLIVSIVLALGWAHAKRTEAALRAELEAARAELEQIKGQRGTVGGSVGGGGGTP